MEEIFFIILATLTIYFSIKISYYADILSNTTKLGKALIGGVLLAGITSLPEFITSTTAILIKNPYLANGDILGSNLFNIFMISAMDLFFINKYIFNKVSNKYSFIHILLLINYIILYLTINNLTQKTIISFGIPSIVITLTYIIYIKKVTQITKEDTIPKTTSSKGIITKFTITAILMILTSISLTIITNQIASNHPTFSSSTIGAILLGITTSLPEVITFYTLIKINNYDLALSNIIGSNLFNLLVLALTDIFIIKTNLYTYHDKEIITMLNLIIINTIINYYQIKRNKTSHIVTYIVPSILTIYFYLNFWIMQIIR